MAFTAEQLAQMQAPLDGARVEHRRQAGQQLSYIEAWDAMATANRIWGFDGWNYTLDRLEQQGDVWLAIVTVRVHAGDRVVTRQDVGIGIPVKPRDAASASPEANETAIKGAVSDALKRALRSFGNQWGLSLYDKDAPEPVTQAQPQPAARPAAQQQPAQPARAASADLGAVPPDQRWNALTRLLDAGPLRGKQQVDWTHGQVTDLGYSKLLEMAPEAWAELVRRAGDVRLATKQ